MVHGVASQPTRRNNWQDAALVSFKAMVAQDRCALVGLETHLLKYEDLGAVGRSLKDILKED